MKGGRKRVEYSISLKLHHVGKRMYGIMTEKDRGTNLLRPEPAASGLICNTLQVSHVSVQHPELRNCGARRGVRGRRNGERGTS